MALPPFMYEPLVSPRLFGALDPTESLTGGGPAYTTVMPGFMPEPAEGPAPVAMTPQEEFLARVQQIEAMVPGVLPAVPPSIMPSPSAPPMMSAPSSDAPGFTPALLDQAASAPEGDYLNPFDPEAYESNAAPLSQSGRVQEVNMPVAGAKPEYTAGGALVFNTGRGAMGGFAIPIPGATYALIDNKTGKVITSGTGQAGLEQVWQAANDRSADMGKKANWSVVGVDPTSGREFSVAKDTPPASALGVAADFVLPAIGGALAGPLGAAAGSGVSSVAQGRSLGDTLLRAGITAGTAAAIGAAPGMDTAAGSKVGSVVGSTAASKASPVLGEIVVPFFKSAVPAFVGSGAGGALSNLAGMTPGKGADFADRVFEQPANPAVQVDPSGNIVVSGSRIPVTGAVDAALPASGIIGAAGAGSVLTGTQRVPENEIIVRDTKQPTSFDGGIPPLPVGFNPGPLGSTLPDMTKTPVDVPNPAEKNSLLDEIIKYYGLASTGLDLLGSAFGGGGAGRMTPYASQLGPMPTFTRGPFTPFGGDYETYGFGPEFNFFGGAPAPTPTGPAMGILPPRANPGFGIV